MLLLLLILITEESLIYRCNPISPNIIVSLWLCYGITTQLFLLTDLFKFIFKWDLRLLKTNKSKQKMASSCKVNHHNFKSCPSILLCRYEFKEVELNETSVTLLFLEISQAFCNRLICPSHLSRLLRKQKYSSGNKLFKQIQFFLGYKIKIN